MRQSRDEDRKNACNHRILAWRGVVWNTDRGELAWDCFGGVRSGDFGVDFGVQVN